MCGTVNKISLLLKIYTGYFGTFCFLLNTDYQLSGFRNRYIGYVLFTCAHWCMMVYCVRCRELVTGTGNEAVLGAQCDIMYTVYKLASGAYFKYSSGGTPVLLFAKGYGTEGKDDVGDAYKLVLGDRTALPVAGTLGMMGMRAGGVLCFYTCDNYLYFL